MGNTFSRIFKSSIGDQDYENIPHEEEILCKNLELTFWPVAVNNNVIGVGTVFKGRLGSRLVAVKAINKQKLKLKQATQTRNEIELLNELQHENVIRFLFEFKKEKTVYVVTEYYYENSLDLSLHQLTEYKTIIVQLINAVNYLQGLKILHLNIQPGNIFIFIAHGKAVAKLANFSCAVKIKSTSADLTGCQLESEDFSAPETYLLNTAFMGSDVYSLGCILLYLASKGSLISYLSKRTRANIFATIGWSPILTSDNILSSDLIVKTTHPSHRERLTINKILEHPLLWDDDQKQKFIVEIWKMLETPDKTFRIILYKNSSCAIGPDEDWTAEIEPEILEDLHQSLQKFREWTGKSKYKMREKCEGKPNIIGLIKILRSILVHANTPLIMARMGTPKQYNDFWFNKFPGLLMHLYSSKCKFEAKLNSIDSIDNNFWNSN